MAKAKRKPKMQFQMPGYDGAVLIEAPVQISAMRSEIRPIRCRPGSFEWSYGAVKGGTGALYHAGVHFSGLWERAHVTVASPGFSSTTATQWRGLPDSRADALSEIKALGTAMGTYAMSRMIDYCILGTTSDEIGAKYRMTARDMRSVLRADLMAVASHFGFGKAG